MYLHKPIDFRFMIISRTENRFQWIFQSFYLFFSISIITINFNNYHLSFIFKISHLSILRGRSTIPNDQITKHRMVRNRSPTFDRLIGRVSNENVQLLLESVRGEIRAKLWTNWARLRFSLDIGDARNQYLYLSVESFVHPTERISHPSSNPLSFVFSQQSNRHWRPNRFSLLVEIILSVSGIRYPIGWHPVLSGGRKRRNKIKNKVREREIDYEIKTTDRTGLSINTWNDIGHGSL